jgi:hypothetical protein
LVKFYIYLFNTIFTAKIRAMLLFTLDYKKKCFKIRGIKIQLNVGEINTNTNLSKF